MQRNIAIRRGRDDALSAKSGFQGVRRCAEKLFFPVSEAEHQRHRVAPVSRHDHEYPLHPTLIQEAANLLCYEHDKLYLVTLQPVSQGAARFRLGELLDQ